MSDVRVSDLKVCVVVGGSEVAHFEFHRTDRHPQDWEVTAALSDPDTRQAVRACLLACIAEIQLGTWEHYLIETEGGGSTNDQPQLPWE